MATKRDGDLTASVRAALPDPAEPAAELALTYAAAIDTDGEQLGDLGPKLLACLDALRLTPKARAAVKGATSASPANPLDELRAKRAARQRDTSAVDTATS